MPVASPSEAELDLGKQVIPRVLATTEARGRVFLYTKYPCTVVDALCTRIAVRMQVGLIQGKGAGGRVKGVGYWVYTGN